VHIVYRGYPVAHDRVERRHREPSFVIDYDEPAVHIVRAEANAETPTHPPSVEWLARFVDRFIDKKDMQREFDVASRVASHREGDCTEHAVLLTALARSFGYAARVVVGDVVLPVDGRYAGVGHAWVEYHRDGIWLPADAAIPPEAHPRYLPISVLEEEGPGVTRGFIESVGLSDVARIELARAKP
jgi:transglutaminase-like putative cysteine protease